ncbi:MAG: hypothetical protein R3E08_00845 [Thiotrichaceae bacterium]
MINVSSEFGHGSTFMVRLPAVQPTLAELLPVSVPEKVDDEAELAQVEPTMRTQQCVLVIDDDIAVQDLFKNYLGKLGLSRGRGDWGR